MADPYFEIDRVSNSSLGYLHRSPAYYKFRKDVKFETRSPALTMGSLVHCLVLEPENFDRDFWILKTENRPELSKGMTSKINKEWKLEQELEQELEHSQQDSITTDELQKGESISRSLIKEAGELINAGDNKFETTKIWEKDGIKMKAKVDIDNPHFLADLKTSMTSNPHDWQRKAYWDFQYHRQGAVYLDGDADGIYTGDKDFFFIVVEKAPPYLVSVHQMSKGLIAKGMTQYKELLTKLKWCQKNDKWPHYEKDVYQWDA